MDELIGTIEYLEGLAPMQGEGWTVDGYPWYFHSRFERWLFMVGDDREDEGSVFFKKKRFSKSEPWGDGPYDAGAMPEHTAREIVIRCLKEYNESMG